MPTTNPKPNERLEAVYQYLLNQPTDINEHFPALRRYAEECQHITEFGTRTVVSTYAFMAACPKRLLTYDIKVDSMIWMAAEIAKENNIEFGFVEQDTTNTEIEETDLLFIDTWHTYGQLEIEFKLHANKARKYIILHDIVSFGVVGEDKESPGLLFAVLELEGWKTKEWFYNNNGLLILERR